MNRFDITFLKDTAFAYKTKDMSVDELILEAGRRAVDRPGIDMEQVKHDMTLIIDCNVETKVIELLNVWEEVIGEHNNDEEYVCRVIVCIGVVYDTVDMLSAMNNLSAAKRMGGE